MAVKLTHIDETGKASMVDVGGKAETVREARASGRIHMSDECLDLVTRNAAAKGDVLGTARIAGIMAAKKTSSLIPLCHTLLLTKVGIDFEVVPEDGDIHAVCTARCTGKTGVEMEALTGVSVALLTIYDMCKAVDRAMVISDICLEEKSGGKSGVFRRGPSKQ